MKLTRIAAAAGMLVMLTGCWDMREAQNTNFVTALAVDYIEDHYVVYAQLIDFTSIAKRESSDTQSKSGSQAIWVGKGEGKSIVAALNHIYDSSQQQTVWTHVKAIILSESVMKSKMDEVFSSILRSREMRYTPWVYGTRDSMPTLLSSMTLLNLSAQTTVMFEPTSIYRQSSDVEPVHLQRLLNTVREPASTVLIPSITSKNRIWTNEGKQPPLSRTDGIFVLTKNTLQGYVPESKIRGTRFVKFYRVFRYPLTVNIRDSGSVLLLIRNPRTTVDIRPEGKELQVSVNIITRANMIEKNTDETVSFKEISEAGRQKIIQDIQSSFEQSQKENMDLFGLEEELYRTRNAIWKEAHDSGEPLLPRFKLKEVHVRLEINHANTYNFKQK